MMGIGFTVNLYGRKVDVAAAGLEGTSYREAVEAARRVSSDVAWVTVTASSALIAEQRHLATAVLYAASALITGKMISRFPEVELLLYLFGTRNIDEALKKAGKISGRSMGAVSVAINGEAGKTLSRIAEETGAELTGVDEEGWVDAYRGYLSQLYPGFPEKMTAEALLGLLRARAALVRLSV